MPPTIRVGILALIVGTVLVLAAFVRVVTKRLLAEAQRCDVQGTEMVSPRREKECGDCEECCWTPGGLPSVSEVEVLKEPLASKPHFQRDRDPRSQRNVSV